MGNLQVTKIRCRRVRIFLSWVLGALICNGMRELVKCFSIPCKSFMNSKDYLTYLFLKKEEWWIRRKRSLFIYIYYWFGRTRSFAYVPVRDQKLVVRGKNFVWLVACFLLVLKKGFKEKSQVAKRDLFVFFNIKEKWLEIGLDWFNVWLKK